MKKVLINKKNYPISFGMMAIANFTDIAKIPLSEFERALTNLTLMDSLNLVLCGLEDGHRKSSSQKDFDISVADLADLFDKDSEALERCMNCLNESLPDAKAQKKSAKGAKK